MMQEYIHNTKDAVTKLIDIVENVPLSLRYQINIYDKPRNEMRYLQGITERMPWRKVGLGYLVDAGKLSEFGIGLSYCYHDMPETFVHEALHVLYPWIESEKVIDNLAETYHRYIPLKKAVQKRIIEEMNRKNIDI